MSVFDKFAQYNQSLMRVILGNRRAPKNREWYFTQTCPTLFQTGLESKGWGVRVTGHPNNSNNDGNIFCLDSTL